MNGGEINSKCHVLGRTQVIKQKRTLAFVLLGEVKSQLDSGSADSPMLRKVQEVQLELFRSTQFSRHYYTKDYVADVSISRDY